MISPLIRWNHNEDWFVFSYDNLKKKENSCERVIGVNVKENDWNFITGHVVDGRILFPGTAYLYIAWETFAAMKGKLEVVVFENVRFERATNMSKDGKVDFLVSIMKGSGYFEILESGTCVVSGRISSQKSHNNQTINTENIQEYEMDQTDIYKELRLRGYNYW